jgi:hypothetical protein
MKAALRVAPRVVVAAALLGLVAACGTHPAPKRVAVDPMCKPMTTGPTGVSGPSGLNGPTGYSGNDSGPTGATGSGPIGYTANVLKREAACGHMAIYWAGPVKGDLYELTREGGTLYRYVRYLPSGAAVGTPGGDFMTVATYGSFPDAFTALKTAVGRKGVTGPEGSVIYVSPRDPRSVLMAFPHSHSEIEVYDPNPKVALAIAKSGRVRPVGG